MELLVYYEQGDGVAMNVILAARIETPATQAGFVMQSLRQNTVQMTRCLRSASEAVYVVKILS